MACDAKGKPLEVGDRVVIRATVLTIFGKGEACNLGLRLDHGKPGQDFSVVEAKQVEKQ